MRARARTCEYRRALIHLCATHTSPAPKCAVYVYRRSSLLAEWLVRRIPSINQLFPDPDTRMIRAWLVRPTKRLWKHGSSGEIHPSSREIGRSSSSSSSEINILALISPSVYRLCAIRRIDYHLSLSPFHMMEKLFLNGSHKPQ